MYFKNRRIRKQVAELDRLTESENITQIQINNLRSLTHPALQELNLQTELDVAQAHLDDARKCNAAARAALNFQLASK